MNEPTLQENMFVGSPLQYIPLINEHLSQFDVHKARKWMSTTLYIPFTAAAIYLSFIYLGRQYMKSRPPFDLRKLLFLWNIALAVFSLWGSIAITPSLVHALTKYGISYTACNTGMFSNPNLSIWSFLFCLSKLIELGDTVFIILRKSTLNFLHWYHHLSVLFFAYYGYGRPISAVEHYFSCINFLVHSIMYTYYALKAVGVRIPSRVAFVITVLQISQMLICLYVTVLAYMSASSGIECQLDMHLFYFAMAMYSSYAILFIHYFIRRYI